MHKEQTADVRSRQAIRAVHRLLRGDDPVLVARSVWGGMTVLLSYTKQMTRVQVEGGTGYGCSEYQEDGLGCERCLDDWDQPCPFENGTKGE